MFSLLPRSGARALARRGARFASHFPTLAGRAGLDTQLVDAPGFVDPEGMDIMRTDVHDADLRTWLSKKFGAEYLSGTEHRHLPTKGFIGTHKFRPFVHCTVGLVNEGEQPPVSVFVAVDTASPSPSLPRRSSRR
jgi:hypothetical protein